MDILSKTVDKMSSYTTNSDVKQVFAVMQNELIKFLRGKKVYIYLAIIVLLMTLDVVITLFLGDKASLTEDGDVIARSFLGDLYLVLIIMTTLFSAGAISSEFEERTALILLTKPIKRPTIVIGKFLASFIMGFATLLLYLIMASIFKLIGHGTFNGDMFAGAGVFLIYVMAITGVAMLISSFAKKSSTSALLTLFVLLILPLILETILAARDLETWYLLGSLGSTGIEVIDGGGKPFRDIAAMIVWAVGTMAGSILLFNKRQF